MMVYMITFYNLFLFIMVVISVAFITLLERKVLGLIQFRLGPNKVGIVGIFQPFSDGIKLLCKGSVDFFFVKGFIYGFMPYFMFFIMLFMWGFIPSSGGFNFFKNGVLLIIVGFSLSIYPIMVGSWFSFSPYSMVGSIRSIAQIISYEVSMIMIVVSFLWFVSSFSCYQFVFASSLFFFPPLSFMLFLSILIELNRTPSDLIEGESELVSGFNTEFYGLNFAYIFLGEYGMILFSSGLYIVLVLGIYPLGGLGPMFLTLVVFFIVTLRGVLPRIRYDELMKLCWVSLVSFSISYFILLVGILSVLW